MSRFSEIAQIYDHRLPQLRSPEVWEQTTTVRLCNPTQDSQQHSKRKGIARIHRYTILHIEILIYFILYQDN